MKISTIVLKVASRCNLNCSYCYMYNMGDMSYLLQPKFISDQVVDSLLTRIKNHVQAHGIEEMSIAFHGGEPLLINKDFYEKFVKKALQKVNNTKLRFAIQTNGILLDDEWASYLTKLNILIGVSIDGNKSAHDKYRKYHSGKGSYDDAIKGFQIAKKYGYKGVITVINVESNPEDVYLSYKEVGIEDLILLIPDHNFDQPPLGIKNYYESGLTLYGDWLVKMYNLWQSDTSPQRPSMRFFKSIIGLILGYEEVGNQLIGTTQNDVLVVETDGSIEAVDPLKICGHNFTKAGMNVLTNEFDEALETPLASMYYDSHHILCEKCKRCPINNICGSGFLPHRYSTENGFNNPSVYCNDLIKIITHIQNNLVDYLPDDIILESGIEKITFQEVRSSFDDSLVN